MSLFTLYEFWFPILLILTVLMSAKFYFPRSKSEASSNWKSLVDKGVIKVGRRKKKDAEKDGANPKREEKASSSKSNGGPKDKLVSTSSYTGITKTLAMDCEMVGVGEKGAQSILARVSIVNQFGHCIYDKYVKPTERVTDYRTAVSGIRREDLEKGEDFKVVQKEVYDIIKGKILVGHAIRNDLKVLFIDHPRSKIRDTSRYFRKVLGRGTPSLKRLTSNILGVDIQSGEHDSVQDAQAAMRLYTMHKKKWEKEIASKKRRIKSD